MGSAAKTLQVYVVEDSGIILRFLTAAIESAGGELIGAANTARRAIAELQTVEPDLVLIDLKLAAGSGFDVLAALQTGAPGRNRVTVVLTNYAAVENRNLSFQLWASHFFDKATQGQRALALINHMAAAVMLDGKSRH
jgi:CheY-like chemotaxis protein